MKELVLNIPDYIDLEIDETTRFLAAELYENGKLSLGQAADMAKLPKTAFADALKDYSVALFNYSADEAIADAEKI